MNCQNCKNCKKNLANSEIFFKLDHWFCSDKCRNDFIFIFHKQQLLHHPCHYEMTQDLHLDNYPYKYSMFASNDS